MRVKGMILAAIAILVLMPAVAMAEWWGITPMMSADGRVDGAMTNMSWSFGGVKKSQEIILAKNISKQRSAVVRQEAESQQFFSAKEMEKLVASIQLPSPIEGHKYLKIGTKPVDPKTFDFLKEDAHILLKDAEVKTVDNGGKISVGWLRAGEILVTPKGETRVIRIWRCGNPVLSELYIVAPKLAKAEAAPVAAIASVEIPAKQEPKKPDLFPQATIDKIAGSGQSPAGNAKWTAGQKWLVGGLSVVAVAAVAYAVGQQNSSSHSSSTTTTTTTTTAGGPGDDPTNGSSTGPGADPGN